MNWFWTFFRLRIKQITQQLTLWVLLMVTIVLALVPVISYAQQAENEILIAVLNQDPGPFSQIFMEEIKEIHGYSYAPITDLAKAKKDLAAGKLEGVLVINPQFSDQLTALDFSDMFTFYVSPTTSIGTLMAELFSEKVIELWSREVLLDDYLAFRAENDQPASDELAAQLREKMEEASQGEPLLLVDYHYVEKDQDLLEQPSLTARDAINQGMQWFGAAVFFFVLVSSNWVLEQRRTEIGERMALMGIRPIVAALASGMAVVAFCLTAAALVLVVSLLWLPLTIGDLAQLIAIMALYLFAAVGVAVLISGLLKTGIDLMIVSPMMTLANAVLGGLFAALPAWAGGLYQVSHIFPGRLLSEALANGSWWGLAVFSLLVFSVSLLMTSLAIGKGWRDND